MTPSTLSDVLADVGYVAPAGVSVAVCAALSGQATQLPALLVTGEPGTGKSALALALARVLEAKLIALQAHAWTDADELVLGVSVPAAVAGDAENVALPGALTRALRASQAGPVVLFLDELDKAPERTEHLLLRFLQERLVTLPGGEEVRAGPHLLLVVATSNGTRSHGEALLRRCARVRVGFLPEAQEVQLVCGWTGVSETVVRAVRKLAHPVAERDGQRLTAQELRSCVDGLIVCDNYEHLADLLAAYAARGPKGAAYLKTRETLNLVRGVWGTVIQDRRARAALAA